MPHATVAGTTLWYEEAGIPRAPAVVLSHALFFDSLMYRDVVAALGETHRVIAYDHRGQGRSAPAHRERLTMDALAMDAALLIQELAAAPCHFVGSAQGGFVALRLALRQPELLRSVSVLGTTADAEQRVAQLAPLVERIAVDGTGGIVDQLMQLLFGETFMIDPERVDDRLFWQRRLLGLPRSVAEAAYTTVFRRPLTDALTDCRVPLLALSGAEDRLYDSEAARHIAELSGGGFAEIARAGNTLAIEQPAAVAAQLRLHFGVAERSSAPA